jgi:peptide-methionine (R)-S-oxide reductase
MNRRRFTLTLTGLAFAPLIYNRVTAGAQEHSMNTDGIVRSDEEWRRLLTPAQYEVLRDQGTERPWTSPLNEEKRQGTYLCAGCDNPLFSSDTKYDSGTGWPSFYDVLEGAVNTRRDFKLILPRTEYHCARCGGHHGHVFNDGPQPTGLRYCNNGVVLKFLPDEA